MRNAQGLFDGKSQSLQPGADRPGMKVEVKFYKFNRLTVEWIPRLSAEQVSKNGLKIEFIRKFQNEDGAGLQNMFDLAKCLWGVCHVMQRADHRGRVK